MNSMVKQALREGAKLEDIAAGLAYSVARNCLQKVLKLRDYAPLGERIVAQGGTFLNPAVQRAFELLIGHRIICPDAAGLSGAWGAALWARDHASESEAAPKSLESFVGPVTCTRREARCKGCSNACAVTLLKFKGAGCHVTGNRCERYFHNGQRAERRGINHMAEELSLLLDRPLKPAGSPARIRIGLPLALGMFENLPFWTTLFVRLGHEVVLSKPTDAPMIEAAIDTFCSDSVCLPARISGAHVAQLQTMAPDVIFFPNVFYEEARPGVRRNFNCPIVAGYPEVTAGAMTGNPRYRVPVATPPVSFESQAALKSTVRRALEIARIDAPNFERAFAAAWQECAQFKERRLKLGINAIQQAERENRKLVILACRPYHLDAYLNRGVPEMLADLGYDVLSSQCLPLRSDIRRTQVLPQWSYPNRALDAAFRAAESKNIQFIQLTSFGCGPDAIVLDEAAALLDSRGKSRMALRVDESTAPGSIRLRLRTLDMNVRAAANCTTTGRISTPPYLACDRHRTFITASMDPWLFSVLVPELRKLGYGIEPPAKTDQRSLDLGLRYVNNEVCYPAILTIGDILKSLESHRQSQSEVAVLLSQTGGQCRASNYAPLLKKAMASAGFRNVPVVTLRLAVGDPLNEQPGFAYNGLHAVRLGMQTLVVTDTVRMIVNALAPRESCRGQAQHIAENLLREWIAQQQHGFHAALDFVEHACRTLSAVPTTARSVPRVGIVGEIYVKYSGFANHNIVPWLVDQGIEPVVPPILNYFTQGPINVLAEHDALLDTQVLVPLGAALVDKAVSRFLQAVNRRLELFPYPIRFPIPREIAIKAAQAISLTHQYGEGWGIAGEILDMADQGVRKVVCLQPFGCIANQVVARGIERRLRAIHPDLQLLYLDLDHNVSEANLFNRLRLLIAPPARISASRLQSGSIERAPSADEFINVADTRQPTSRLGHLFQLRRCSSRALTVSVLNKPRTTVER
jgi:predicted nucleotide-binding protein (sugar kinase/HSP70/actin superfamily)